MLPQLSRFARTASRDPVPAYAVGKRRGQPEAVAARDALAAAGRLGEETRRGYERYWTAFLDDADALVIELPQLPPWTATFWPPLAPALERRVVTEHLDALATIIAMRHQRGGRSAGSVAAVHSRKAVGWRVSTALGRDVDSMSWLPLVHTIGAIGAHEAAERNAAVAAGGLAQGGAKPQRLATPLGVVARALLDAHARVAATLSPRTDDVVAGAGILLHSNGAAVPKRRRA